MRNAALLFFMLFSLAQAQESQFLRLTNSHETKSFQFNPGDHIHLRGADKFTHYRGIFQSANDSVIVIVKPVWMEESDGKKLMTFKDYVPISEVTAVFVVNRNSWYHFRKGYYRSAIVSGTMAIATESLKTLFRGENPQPHGIVLASGIMTSGLLMRFAGKYKYKLGKNWKLQVVENESKSPPITHLR